MRAAQIVSQPQPEPKPREFIEGADMGTAPIRFGIYAPATECEVAGTARALAEG